MVQPRTIALDAMGGDYGPEVVVPGAAISLVRHPALSFLIAGDEARIRPVLEQHANLKERSEILHTELAVNMHDKPSQALRRGKGTSMWLALEAVKQG
jgi:glycerol-3-phosphate acyltransferase PlsX